MNNLSYDFNEGFMVYGSYSKEFKNGGFLQRVFLPLVAEFTVQPASTPDIDLIPTFEHEFVEIYEVDFKLSGFDNHIKLNGAAYHTKYDDLRSMILRCINLNTILLKITLYQI